MPVTRAQATEMRDAIKQLEAQERQDEIDQFQADMAIAEAWWQTIKPASPTTRAEALSAYNFIVGLLQTETDEFRVKLLKRKLDLANEKFRERKANE